MQWGGVRSLCLMNVCVHNEECKGVSLDRWWGGGRASHLPFLGIPARYSGGRPGLGIFIFVLRLSYNSDSPKEETEERR
jgi:hypothetical protein